MFTKNIFNQKPDALVDMIDKINEADYKVKMEALKGGQHKIDKNKNNKIDAHDFKILRGEKKVNEGEVEEAAESPFTSWKKPREAEVKGDSGVKKGSRYGGSKQKDKPEQEDDKKKVAEAVKEDSEQIDELSKKTLKSYVGKAVDRVSDTQWRAGKHWEKGNKSSADYESRETLKRMRGIHKATGRMAKEEVEQVDEAMRIVSKHGVGTGEHHAVVKRDPEWNEYQVHFYKGGKHMGEGPVSHHDDKADAQSTADTEVKRMNAKKNEDFNLEDIDPALVEEFMQTEEFEQLDELSKKTLGNYIKRASYDSGSHGYKAGKAHADDKDEFRSHIKKFRDRTTGVKKAVDRLAKEDVEQTDEAATMQPKGPARVDVPAYKRVNMKPLSLKDVVTKSTEKKNKLPNAVKEESEQVDELSKKTLSSYAKKATDDVSYHSFSAGLRSSKDPERLKDDKKAMSRQGGVNKAIDRLAKEEVEQIDELSKETLKSYQDKALKSNPGTRRGYERVIGVARSAEKLKKKEIEQVDELSRSKLQGYIHGKVAAHADAQTNAFAKKKHGSASNTKTNIQKAMNRIGNTEYGNAKPSSKD
jgi:hypothetical protein